MILWRTVGLDLGRTWTPATETIVWDLRMPRVLTAMLVGAALAVAGATFQGLLRNPLADPYVLGTASGAALGAAIAVVLPISVVVIEFGMIHGLAFAGALITAFVVFRLGGGGSGGLTRLLLTGYAVGSILAAMLTMAMYMSGAEPARDLLVPARRPRRIVVDPAGGRHAHRARGLPRHRVARADPRRPAARRHRGGPPRHRCPQGARHPAGDGRMATAAAVAISGLIGFVGLVVPHVVRLIVGPGARRVIPLSALVGATLLVAADLVARLVGDIPVGVVMALLGAPFFLVLLLPVRTGYEL